MWTKSYMLGVNPSIMHNILWAAKKFLIVRVFALVIVCRDDVSRFNLL